MRRPLRGPRSAASKPAPSPSGREIAARVLSRVAVDDAWVSRTLDAELARARLHPAEAARATDITYGALRAARALDTRIAAACDRGLPEEPVVLAALRGAAYELTHTSAESHAVVDAWVGAVKRERGLGLSRFANAVLRKLAKARPPQPEPVRATFAPWIQKEAERTLGARVERFFHHASAAPSLSLRARGDRAALVEALRVARPEASVAASALSALGVTLRGAGDPRRLPGFAEGAFTVQDEGSQWIASCLGARSGERVVDACSGRGGKTLVLAEAVGPVGHIIAVDVSAQKLEQLARDAARLGLAGGTGAARVESRAVDLTVGLGGLAEASFDRVLVDAPCTGLGTLGRRPEIALRLAEGDVARMAELQRAILANAARLVKLGGRLVYAVCSIAGAEAAHATSLSGFTLTRSVEVGGRTHVADPDGVFRIGPWTDDAPMDAYQVVVLERA